MANRNFILLLLLLTGIMSCQRQAVPSLYDEGEQSLLDGRIDDARRLVFQGQREASDSDHYYLYEVLRSKLYLNISQPDSFLQSNQQLAQYLHSIGPSKTPRQQWLEMQYELQLGVYESKILGRMDSSLTHHLQALRLSEQLENAQNERLMIQTNLADVYKMLGRYDESIRYYGRAYELGDSLGMTPSTRNAVVMGIAAAYTAMRNFDESNHWWELAAQYESQMTPTEHFLYLNNRGNDYYLQGRYEESLRCFLRLDSLYSGSDDTEWERMYGHTNMADLYLKLGKPEKAMPLLDEVEPFFRQQNLDMALYYIKTQRIEMARLYGKTADALRLAAEDDHLENIIPEQRLLRLEVNARLYEQTENWKELAQTTKAHDMLEDSIAGYNTRMRFSTALMRYQHEKKMLEKEQQLDRQRLSNRWTIAIAVFIIAFLTTILLQRHRVQRIKVQGMHNQIERLRMETVRNRITPHFISNALSNEMLAQMDGRPVDFDPLVQLLHRGIEMTGCEWTTLNEELEFIRFYCGIESSSVGSDFELRVNLKDDVDAEQAQLPSMALQILVENAIKHGLKRKPCEEGKKRFVAISAQREGDGTRVLVSDNGVGLPEEHSRNEHTGLRVLRQTIQLLNSQNSEQMQFDLFNYHDPDGVSGCRASIFLPDHYEYVVKV